ncbi:hypothetical protein PG984_007044 [Apiospora sp. TS-2023a]
MEKLHENFSKVVVDENGDLLIMIADKSDQNLNKQFLVNSHIVRRSSEKWADLIKDRHDGSGEPHLPWMILKGEVASYGMLFSIMHCNFADVPAGLNQSELCRVLEVTEEYQITYLLRPWAAMWIKDLQNDVSGCYNLVRDAREILERLYIAWALGEKVVFRNLIEHLASNIIVDNESILLDIVDETLSELPRQDIEIPGLFGA